MAKDRVCKKANKELKKTIENFEINLLTLRDFAPTQTIKYKIDIQENAFKQYKKTILDNSKKSIKELINTNTLFLTICDDLVNELINFSKDSKNTKVIDNHQDYVIENIALATVFSGN